MNFPSLKSPLVFVAVLALSGCAGNGEGLDNSGRPLGEAAQLPLVPEFDSIQAHVFTPICSVCHAGALAPQGLRLDAANSYNLLVGVASTEVPSLQRVKPGDPDNSYIIRKLEGTASVGVQMPYGGPPLPAATITMIRQWIANGALRSPVQPLAVTDFKLATAAPANDEVMFEAPPQIMLGFTVDLDTTRADAGTVRLERFDPDNPDLPAIEVPATVSVPATNARALIVTPRQRLAAGHYRVVIAGPYSGGLTDLSARRPNMPLANVSGDQIATQFTVEPSIPRGSQ